MDKSSIVLDIKQTNATTKQSPSCRLKVNCEISSSLTSVLIVLNDRNSLWRRIIRYVFIASLESARTWQQCDTFIRKPVVEVEIRDGGGLSPSSLHLRHSCHSLWRNNNIYLYREEGKELFNFNRCCKVPIKYCINIVIRFFVTSELLRIRLLKTEVDDSYVKVWYKVLPLFSWKRLDLHLAWMTTKNGGPVSRFFKVFLSHLKQRFVCNPAHWSKWFQPF